MDLKEIEVYSEASNYGIVRMPGRYFPGCVIQGDSLFGLLLIARRALRLARNCENVELVDECEELVERLADRLVHYESVIRQHGFTLPYNHEK